MCSMHVFGDLIFQQLEQGIDQQTGSKLAKEFIKVIYGHLAYLTYMQTYIRLVLDEAQAGIKFAGRNINIEV